MPGFDGLTALQMTRINGTRHTFCLLSGTIGEERAIEALKHGAADYVLKESPARLLAAVHGALQQGQQAADKRHAEESLRQSQEQFQQIAKHRRLHRAARCAEPLPLRESDFSPVAGQE